MAVLFATHDRYLDHLTGSGHPERPSRMQAVVAAARDHAVADAIVALEPRPATREELKLIHPAWYLDKLDVLAERGGGWIDEDTRMGPRSMEAAALAAGAGLAAVEALERGEAAAAFCAVRPPGHHATPTTAMGFCLVSNISVVAASLAARGERVWILDVDAHHGNGTQAAFESDPRVLFVSLHEWPLYPGTGRATETGTGDGVGATLNVPLPAGATGDVYLHAFDDVIAPVVERFQPTWLLISAGFDAHRADPLTDMGLSAGDYPALVARAMEMVPPNRTVAMLEGGYDLDALTSSTVGVLGALAGLDVVTEPPTAGGPGDDAVARVRSIWME
ncbi:MAG: histone deacetylase family protein [Desertimonas sp.]